jgi:hypothetical protein
MLQSRITGYGEDNVVAFDNFKVWDISDNVSKVFPTHLLRAGVYYNNAYKMQTAYTATAGILAFGSDTSNPNDSGWAFSNAMLGNFTSFQQASVRNVANMRSYNLEWYVQDTWKISRKLTLDYGGSFECSFQLSDSAFNSSLLFFGSF